VSVPDLEGPLAASIAGPQKGHAALNSVRAIKSLRLGLRPDARVTLRGYSGGSFATEYASEMQVQCAPELQISGFAPGGLVVNAAGSIEYINRASPAGLIPLELLGLTAQYPEARAFLVDQLTYN
jgi:hypothetical protein